MKMPNHRDPETLLIRPEESEAARRGRPPLRHWPSSPRAAAPMSRVPPPPLAPDREKSLLLRVPGTLTAMRLKVTTTLDAAELLAVPVPVGKPRVTLRIRLLPDRALTAEIAAKSLRRALRAIRETGADNVALVLQGRLSGDTIAEAGLSAQPRAAKSRQAP
jgi:hypothetical protein